MKRDTPLESFCSSFERHSRSQMIRPSKASIIGSVIHIAKSATISIQRSFVFPIRLHRQLPYPIGHRERILFGEQTRELCVSMHQDDEHTAIALARTNDHFSFGDDFLSSQGRSSQRRE